MGKKIVLLLAIILYGANIFAAGNSESQITADTQDSLNIVTTGFPCFDFARAVTGKSPIMLLKPGIELHTFDPSPANIIAIEKSDVFIYVGGESDKWVSKVLESINISNKTVIRLMDYIETSPSDNHAHKVDEHIWTSPANAIILVKAIAEELGKIDTAHKQFYNESASYYCHKIEEVDAKISAVVSAANKKLIIMGDRFPLRYFADYFGLEYEAAFTGCSSAVEVSASTIAYLIDLVKKEKASAVFSIELSNQKIAKTIAEPSQAQILELHSIQHITKDDFSNGESYVTLMERNADALKKGLK